MNEQTKFAARLDGDMRRDTAAGDGRCVAPVGFATATGTNSVNVRLGRRHKLIGQHKAKAERRRILEVANQLATETDWRGDLVRSVKDVIDIDDCEEMYR